MSIASLIASLGRTMAVRRPTFTQSSNGATVRTESTVATVSAFIQERASAEQDAQGRTALRNATVIYIEGVADIRTDDELSQPEVGTAYIYRVTGVRVPDGMDALSRHVHTIVDAVRILPTETIPADA